jgi:hypothetical protein
MCRDQHVGHQPDGALITWTVDDCPTPEQHAANMAEAKAAHAEHTRAFLTSLDLDVLAEFLTQAGTVPR